MVSAVLSRGPVELGSLVAHAAQAAGAAPEPAVSLALALLALPEGGSPDSPWRTRSGLNNDGSPLEVCFSSFADACRTRLVCDPAAHLADPAARCRASLAALERAFDLTSSRALEPLCRHTLAALLPAAGESLADYVEGVLWLGAGLGFPGLALYVDATRGSVAARFDRIETWWREVLPAADAACAALAHLRPLALPMAAGVEGTMPANARAKLFFRLGRPLALADLGLDAFTHPRFVAFLRQTLTDRALALKGLVFSLSFAVATGEPFEAKIDVCGHCLSYGPPAWSSLTAALAAAAGLVAPPLAPVLGDGAAEVAYLGLARNVLGQERLDVFVKPVAAGGPSAGGRFHA